VSEGEDLRDESMDEGRAFEIPIAYDEY